VWGGWHDGRVSNVLAVDPFRAAFDEGSMADLREWLARSRLALPGGEGWERGVPGGWLSALLADWQAFDVSRFQARLDRLTHLRANLDGQVVHLLHLPGRGPDPMPLLLTHGWPGSFCEYLDLLPLLTDPQGRNILPFNLENYAGEKVPFLIAAPSAQETLLREMVKQTQQKYPEVKISIDVKENYKNMKEILRGYPQLTEVAMEAARRAGLEPHLKPIRGGTDGATLTVQGLPCPNLFTGGQNFHGKLEFNSRKGLEKTSETLVNLVQIFAEKTQ
jgi:hypothetical protein